MIGGLHDVGIVLDNEDGVADIAELGQDINETRGVAAVQADRGFVENVAGANKTRAETGGQLDALRFATGESRGEAVERQVFKTDIVQELEALSDFGEDLACDAGFFRREGQGGKEVCGLGDIETGDVGYGEAGPGLNADGRRQDRLPHADIEGLFAKTRAVAVRAFRVSAVSAQEHTHVHLVLLGFVVVEKLADAVEFRLAVAFENKILLGLREVGEGDIEADAFGGFFTEIIEPFLAARLGPGLDCAFVDREAAIGNDEIERVIDGVSKALAARAGFRRGCWG